MSLPLWMAIEPVGSEVRLMLTAPSERTVLKARLPNPPTHPRAVIALLESLSLWYGRPLRAVIDADGNAPSPVELRVVATACWNSYATFFSDATVAVGRMAAASEGMWT